MKKKLKFKDLLEAAAAGFYFGASNLACDYPVAKLENRLLPFKGSAQQPNWARLKNDIENHLGIMCEGDEKMFNDMLRECRRWVKNALEGDQYVTESWRKEVIKKFNIKTSLA